jgi:hypothetical protein
MKQYSKKLFSVAMLLSTAAVVAESSASLSVSPFLQWRSQGRNTARKLVGTTTYAVDQPDMESMYGTFFATLEYDRSFRPQNISDALFGDSLVNLPNTPSTNKCDNSCNSNSRTLIINGTDNAQVNAKEWMAENFLLPSDFTSTVTFKPLVQNILVDFDWYMGLDKWVKGLYFRLYGPVVNNRTNLRATEDITHAPVAVSDTYQAGYFAQTDVATDQLFGSALEFFHGDTLPGTINGITVAPLAFAKWNGCGHMSKTGFAELRGEFGWNYLRENYRVGLNIQAAAPTGTRPKGEWLLEPQIGNGKHWELGVGLSGHWTMWRSEDEEKHFDLVLEADITHLFNAKQKRTFDLLGKPNSRYMLAEKLTTNKGTTNSLSGDSNADLEFANAYSPVANFSTRDITVNIGAQGDAIIMLNYTSRGFSWDLGYNIWGMSRENIHLSNCDNAFPENIWALKGDASIAGTASVGGSDVTVLLAATESFATIHSGTNVPADGIPGYLTNGNVNNKKPATTEDSLVSVPVHVFTQPTTQIYTSNLPVFIKEADLDIPAAQLKGYSNKLFTHLSYTWIDREDWIPYFGIGFNAEFGHFSNNNNDNDIMAENNTCDEAGVSFALSKWAVLLKGGVSFD